jgi:hypothetical protein
MEFNGLPKDAYDRQAARDSKVCNKRYAAGYQN